MQPTFDQELEDVERLLLQGLPKDTDLNDLYESTEVEVQGNDPSELEARGHKVHAKAEPSLTRNNLFARPDAHPLILNLLMLEHFEHSWLDWDPELVDDTVHTLFGEPHPVNLGKLLAAQAAFTKTAAWDEWHYFVFTCQAFNDELVDPHQFRPPTAAEVAVTVTMLRTLDDKPKFSEEVTDFIRQVLIHENFLFAPAPLEFVGAIPDAPAFDRAHVDRVRQHPNEQDESMEGFLGRRLHDYDQVQHEVTLRLRAQLRVVRR